MDLRLFRGVCALLLTMCTTQASYSKDKEYVYKYEGSINAYGESEKWFTSGFKLTGDLHVQTDDTSAVLKLSELKYDFYNGEEHDEYTSNPLPLTEDLHDFAKAFKVKYEPSGNVDGISIFGDEKQYVVNFKKAISSLLQVNFEEMGKHHGDHFAFHAEESSLFGKGKVYYTVEDVENGSRYVQIMQEPKDGRHLFKHTFSNVEYENAVDFDKLMNRESQKKLYLNKDSVIDWVEQSGSIYNMPFNTHGETNLIYVNQTLTLKHVEKIEKKLECTGTEVYYDNLDYYVGNFEEIDSTVVDFSNGRRKRLGEEAVDVVFNSLLQIKDMRTQYKIKASEPDYKQAFLFSTLTEKMYHFDENLLEKLFTKIADLKDQKILDVYIESLIETGTYSVYHHLMKLIKDGKINADNGDSVENVFTNVKFPNKKLVEDMSEILKWDYTKVGGMKSQMILSFGTLLHKAIVRHWMYTTKTDYSIHGDYSKDFPGEEYYEKYIQTIFEHLKTAEGMDKKILYLQTLYNTKFASVAKHLIPYVRDNLFKDDFLRSLASYVIAPMVLKDEDLTFEIYWPLLFNSKLPLTSRANTYYILMKSKPNMQRLINIFWLMESVKDREIYKIHYDYIKQVSESEDPNLQNFAYNLRKILKYSTKPVAWGLSSYTHVDYFDKEYSLGEHIRILLAHSKYENDLVITGSYRYMANGLVTKPCWAFLRLSGFEPSFLRELKLDPTSKKVLFTWENLYKAVIQAIKNKDSSVTVIFAKNDNVVYSAHFDQIKEYYDLYKKYFSEKSDFFSAMIDPTFDLSHYTILPTDLGFPAVYFNRISSVDFADYGFNKNKATGEYMFELKMKLLKNTKRGLSYYNPILDVEQGVAKLNFVDQEVNFRMNVTFDYEHGTLKAAYDINKPTEFNKELYSVREYSTAIVYVRDEFNKGILQKSYPDCKNFVKVSLGDAYKIKKDGNSLMLFDIGHDYKEKIFDVEFKLPSYLDPNYIPEVETADSEDLKSYVKSILRSTFIEEHQPKDINYGILRHIHFNEYLSISEFELVLKYDAEYQKGDDWLYPAVVYKFKMHFTAGNPTHQVTSWVGDAKFTMDEGHKNNNFAINLVKTIGEVEIKGCVKGDAVWTNEDFKGKVSFSTNLINNFSCDGGEPVITLEITGEESEEQKKGLYNYETCYDIAHGIVKYSKTIDCLFEYSNLRKFTFKISHNIPAEKQKEYEEKVSNQIEKIFVEHNEIAPLEDVKENEIRAVFEIPMRPADNVQVLVYMEKSGYAYEISDKIDTEGLGTVSGTVFEFMHEYGLTDICEIDNIDKKIYNGNGKEIHNEVSAEWDLYLSQAEFKVFTKSTEGNKFAIKFVQGKHTLLIEPSGTSYVFTLDGTKLDGKTHLANDWVYFAWIKDSKIVSVYVKKVGSLAVYSGDQASIEYVQVKDVEMHGHCTEQSNRTD